MVYKDSKSYAEGASTAIELIDSENEILSVFPNPLKMGEVLHMKGIYGETIIQIIDITGKVSETQKVIISQDQYTFFPKTLGKGIYIVRVENNNTRFAKQILAY